ncbi:MAG: hypothetical protein R3B13_08925 [Polyangiaceae bacterium]
MADRRDDSMLFPFKGLFDLGRKRVQPEEEARLRQVEIERLEQEQRERLVAEARARRLKAEEATRHQYELRAREEAARLEAFKLAAVEHARADAEARARAREADLERSHQERLEAFRHDAHLRGVRRTALFLAGAWVLTVLTGGALYFAKLEPETARLQDAYDRLVTAERARSSEATRLLERAEQKRRALAKDNEALREQLVGTGASLRESKAKPRAKRAPARQR